jgi:glycosyltransferase involved in cell wall biosynthesis
VDRSLERRDGATVMNSAKRIAIVTGVPAPYREPVFERLANRSGVELKVFYCTDSHHNVAWSSEGKTSFEYVKEFPRNFTPKRFQRLPFFGYTNFGLSAALRDYEPDFVIVYGYNQSAHWMAFRYCLANDVPFALRSDSNVHIDLGLSWQNNIRRRLLRWLVKRAAAVLPVGSANRSYWEAFGAKPSQIHLAPYAVDNERIANAVGERHPDLQGRVRFLYVGRLLPRKGVDLLIEAFNRIAGDRCSLTVVGDGPEAESLKAAQTPKAASRTNWTGKLSNEETLKRYADADVFVLPSRYEPWGLVVNEAMAAGLPVIADRRCGAAIDLIDDGNTGLRLDELSAESLGEAMSRYIADPQSAAEQGTAARQRIQHWNFNRTVDGFLRAFAATARSTVAGEFARPDVGVEIAP